MRRRLFIAVPVGALVVGPLAMFAFRGATPPSVSVSASAPNSPSSIVEWCGEGLIAIEGGGCWAAPSDARTAPVVLYLHGRYDASTPADELDRQKRVAKEGTKRGFAVLALRGEVGACGRPELANFVCWPSNERNADAGPTFVDRWRVSLAEVARRTDSTKRFVFGFSNGAYFAGLIATRGLFDAAAFVVAAGGPVNPVTRPTEKGARMPPILLLTGDEDPSADDTVRFGHLLTAASWPNDIYSRDGAHLLTDADIRNAFTFLERSQREATPLIPPLSARRPAPHAAAIPASEARDASAEPVDGEPDGADSLAR